MLLRMSLTGTSIVIEHNHYNVGVHGKVDLKSPSFKLTEIQHN